MGSVPRFKTESGLQNALVAVLHDKGLNTWREVPFLGGSLDIVYRSRNGSITVIEVKRLARHVRRALDQAKFCLLGADRVYVCTLPCSISHQTGGMFSDLGVGLMFLRRERGKYCLHYVIPAGRNGRRRREYRRALLKALREKMGDSR